EKAHAYAVLKTTYQPADVILDPDTAHPNLLVSEDRRSLQWTDTEQSLPDNPRRFSGNFCVLGCESFTTGRHFWEVDVVGRTQWYVGVCRENVERKCLIKLNPESGFWIAGMYKVNDCQALTEPRTPLSFGDPPPQRVGVFLDYEKGEVSFYNAIDGSHIYTFKNTSFSGPLWPVFRILLWDPTALTICPAQREVGNALVTVPVPDPSLETTVASGSADGNEDPQAEVTSLLLAAQPGAQGLLKSKVSQ
ncbi:PREDICTED: butyrophilin subfamily 3 member A3-like, partial [Miniopterus natalensis]|uniref:butyrophilin subfamily 3 member A3-like n=1 Tax=Miniopterus natalensis TaxID=291302 RepID=UPI0007A6FBA0